MDDYFHNQYLLSRKMWYTIRILVVLYWRYTRLLTGCYIAAESAAAEECRRAAIFVHQNGRRNHATYI